MKKLYLLIAITIIYFLWGCSIVKAEQCGTDTECYEAYSRIDTQTGESYFEYYYEWKFYNISVPKTRHEFRELEWLYVTGNMSKYNKYYTTMKLNVQLIKMWLEPLIY